MADGSSKEVAGEHSIIPMINVVFLILIFFMIAGSFQKFEVDGVELPVSNSDHPLLQQQEVLKLNRSGSVLWRDKEFLIEELQAVVSETLLPGRLVVVTSYDIHSRHVINLIDELRKSGAKSLTLVTLKERSYAESNHH